MLCCLYALQNEILDKSQIKFSNSLYLVGGGVQVDFGFNKDSSGLISFSLIPIK